MADHEHVWALNPFGWYCGVCGHQVLPDLSESEIFDFLNYPQGADDAAER